MNTLVFVDLKPAPDKLEPLKQFLADVVDDTRSFDGNGDIRIYHQGDGDRILMVERWQSEGHYQKYLAWRTETGVMDTLGEMLEEAPIIRFAEDTGA